MRIPFLAKRREPKVEERVEQRPPSGEISLRDPLIYPRGSHWTAYNPDLLTQMKGGLIVYEKMMTDDQVSVCQMMKRLAVVCSGWNIEPASDEPADVEAADFVTDTFTRINGTFEEKIRQFLSCLDYGFSVTEKIWSYQAQGEFRGRIVLSNLKTRKPHNWDFDTDEFGNLRPKGLWQMNGTYKYDPRKFVLITHNGDFDNLYGTSDLRRVYRNWFSKDVLIKFWNLYLERFANGGIPTLKPKEGKSIPEPVYTNLKNAIANIQNGSSLAWNHDAAEVEFLELGKGGAGARSQYEYAIKYHDIAIARGLLMPQGIGFSEDEKSGSYARSKTHFDVWMWIMLDLRKRVEEIINEQIIPELTNYNFNVQNPPRFVFNPLDEPEVQGLAEIWLKAIEAKAVHSDVEDELHFRKIIKFPERDREELEAEIEEEKQNPPEPPPMFKPEVPPPQKETIELHSSKWHRDLTRCERRVSFSRIEQDLNGVEAEARSRLTSIFKKQMERTLQTVEKAWDKINQAWIQAFYPQYGLEIQTSIKEFTRAAYEVGRVDASQEIARARGRSMARYVVKIPPEKMLQELEKSAFWIKGVTLDSLTKNIQALLMNAIETGEAPAETQMKIRKAYEPYIGDEQKVQDQKQIEPYRIETVIRTNTTKAYARGRWVEYNDPEIDGFVRAVQLSAILDSRTTDTCMAADGKIVMIDDPLAQRLLPPLHFNCRTIQIPVTEADGAFEPSKQAELHEVLEEMPAEFGGNVDR